ncbi:S24 family peptidase [uncultured Bacteroides sp.]|uniref:S24 family peptidase n=1 Tax=uncultured Bacteroides sp. TaxID=162156 RepID=UPI00262E9235|nr:S24 family peptidase [uncultured Bacteroides sp.]
MEYKKTSVDTKNMPYANKKVYELIQKETNGNVRAFAQSINVSQQSLNRIFCIDKRNGKYPSVSNEIKKGIIDVYGKDEIWFISDVNSGEGEMLNSESSISSNDIKEGDYSGTLVYDIDATCGTDQRGIFFTQDNIIGSVNLPGINKGSQIVRANGDSMEPRIFDGNMVVIREIHSWEDIFYGQMYLVLLDEYRMIKYIRRYEPDEENYIILRSENPKYDDIKLHKGKIRKMFIVENILSVKTQL